MVSVLMVVYCNKIIIMKAYNIKEKTVNIYGVKLIVKYDTDDNEIQTVKVEELVDVYELLSGDTLNKITEEL